MSIAPTSLRTRVSALLTGCCLSVFLAGYGAATEPGTMLLVAGPGLVDPHFSRTVVLVTRTPRNETIGLILNRPLGRGGDRPAIPDEAQALGLHSGGPVAPKALLAIGTLPKGEPVNPNAVEVLPGLHLVVGSTAVRTLVQGSSAGRVKIFAGYAGWLPGQLEREITLGGWRVAPLTEAQLFDPHPETQWERLSTSFRAVQAPARAPGNSERLLGPDEFGAVYRTHIDLAYFTALQDLEGDGGSRSTARPELAIKLFERFDRFVMD